MDAEAAEAEAEAPLPPLYAHGDVLTKMRQTGLRMPIVRHPVIGCCLDKDGSCDGFCRCLRAFFRDFVSICM